MVADVRKAVGTFVEHRAATDEVLRDALESAGRTRQQADALLVFMPLAFARVLLADLGVRFTPTYRVATPSGESAPRRLAAHPVFYAATAVAKMGIGRDAVLAVAERSAEFKLVNNALHDGAKPKHLLMAEPVLLAAADEAGDAGVEPAPPPPPPEPRSGGWLGRLLGR